jgi:hypothetical protein
MTCDAKEDAMNNEKCVTYAPVYAGKSPGEIAAIERMNESERIARAEHVACKARRWRDK